MNSGTNLTMTSSATPPPILLCLVLAAVHATACQPCDCDINITPENGEDVDPDPDDDPLRDRFRPGRMAIEGAFAFEPTTGRAVGWRDDDGDHSVALYVRMTDDRFLGTADPRHRCRVRIVPTAPVTAQIEPFTFSFGGGDPERDYVHLMVTLQPGTFGVIDAPYETVDGGQVRGCIDIEEDPERGFSLRFGDGSVTAWAHRQSWGIGVGGIAPIVQEHVESSPETSHLLELWDSGYVGGGSARLIDDNVDFIAPIGIGMATALDDEGNVIYDRGLPVLLPASSFTEIGSDDDVLRALYEVRAFYAITFE